MPMLMHFRLKQHAKNEAKVVRMMPALVQQEPEPKA